MTPALFLLVGALSTAFSPLLVSSGPQPSLEPVATRFAQAWRETDVVTLGEMMRPSGILLHLPGEEHLSILPRQVRAALRDLMKRYPGGETRLAQVAPSGGDPTKGFADIRWSHGTDDGGGGGTFTLFVAFALEGSSGRLPRSESCPLPHFSSAFIMSLKLYNTLTRSLAEFQPMDPDKVLVYGCGPTVYDFPHIGNFRTFVVFDLLHRYLEWSGYTVRFVTNLTDIDDKVINGALKKGVTIREFTTPFAEAFLDDAGTLGIQPADLYPKATEYVEAMVEFIGSLAEKGLAYQVEDGSVFFSIGAFPNYGKLSRIDPDNVRPGARVATDDYGKDDARDFALWKAAKPEDEETGAAWDSPWGRGRPGWHLECSVMCFKELGETLDIHLGGEDLIFPHHEDEIAQSEGVTGKPFVRHWLHIKHLLLEGQKMSKSLGNTVSVRDLLARGHDQAAIRHQLLSAQYRRELNFTMEGLEGSGRAVQRLLDFQARLEEVPVVSQAPESRIPVIAEKALDNFRKGMDDDLNSSEALAALFIFVNEVNGELDGAGGGIGSAHRDTALETLEKMDQVLGLLELAHSSRELDEATEEWIQEQIRLRKEAREGRDFAAADAIRDELAARGIVLEDSADGTRWKVVKEGGGPA